MPQVPVYKVLIVDDEPDILEFLSYNLIKEGYQVTTAGDGLQAISKAKEVQPDLIMLDIMMPNLDGVETCIHLRSLPQFAQTIIVFLTAREEDALQIDALNIGGDDFITKPIKPKVLLSRIQALFRRSARYAGEMSEEEKSEMRFPNLAINKATRIVTHNNEQLIFAKKEFEILWLLAEKPGRVFTRDEIYAAIWGSDVIVGNRTIDVHISKLREKFGGQFIKTFKGIGYKFEF
jgi:two-component system, OmpR family, alkaline phosphatase synthesis response regulator PhoP